MKKLTILIVMIFGYFTNANAFDGVQGFNLGVSLSGGVFDVDGAKEEFKGAHVGSASPGDIVKNSTEDTAEGLYAIGSIFAEVEVTDVLAIGLDYVPHSLDTETTENTNHDFSTNEIIIPNNNDLYIATRTSNPYGEFIGKLKDVRLYNFGLTILSSDYDFWLNNYAH